MVSVAAPARGGGAAEPLPSRVSADSPGRPPLFSPQDLHVYISEHEHFTDFNATSALFWEQRDLVYGDWTGGENFDGCYEHYSELEIPEVGGPLPC